MKHCVRCGSIEQFVDPCWGYLFLDECVVDCSERAGDAEMGYEMGG